MDNPTEIIKRNRYFIEGAPDIPHSSRDHADDFQEYHLPLMRMHHAHLHDPGIAGGLAVGVTVEGDAVEVQPGVAVCRASTRRTLPSRIAAGRSVTCETMALAVLRPMPGSASSLAGSSGSWPPCSRAQIPAVR